MSFTWKTWLGVWFVVCAALGCDEDSRNRLMVETKPLQADVYVNDVLIGKAPVRCRLIDKRPEDLWEHHVIEAKKKGYQTARKEFRYRSGAAWLPERVTLTLEPALESPAEDPVETKTEPEPKVEVAPAPTPEPAPEAPEAREATAPANPYARTSPWTTLAPPAEATPGSSAAQSWVEPNPERRITIELRLAALQGVRVIRQVSASGRWDQRETLVAELVKVLVFPEDNTTTAALVELHNRRDTSQGQGASSQITQSVLGALQRSGRFKTVARHNFRTLLGGDGNLESTKVLQDQSVRTVLAGVPHVILGGVALADEDTEIEAARKRAELAAKREAEDQARRQAEEEQRAAEEAQREAEQAAEEEKRKAEQAAEKAAEEKAEDESDQDDDESDDDSDSDDEGDEPEDDEPEDDEDEEEVAPEGVTVEPVKESADDE
ncbi:MAG: hypothetical protein HN909_07405 [Phycisphaerales bacterium]|jgi:hypothetical protein|nr:hypothetical protein [Phycisphaerales bacterium]MBT7171579.1 hypothetical protein [Phycisphaerales bacterium]